MQRTWSMLMSDIGKKESRKAEPKRNRKRRPERSLSREGACSSGVRERKLAACSPGVRERKLADTISHPLLSQRPRKT